MSDEREKMIKAARKYCAEMSLIPMRQLTHLEAHELAVDFALAELARHREALAMAKPLIEKLLCVRGGCLSNPCERCTALAEIDKLLKEGDE